MPTTSIRRLISPLRRSIGAVECSLVRRWREGDVGEHIGLDEGAGKFWAAFAAELIGDLAPLRSRGLGIVLGKRGGDEAGDDVLVGSYPHEPGRYA
ncbi:hypothetical protein IVB19_39020 (plasmid) [Bradyrhizobium sp. 187]|nr:hypothetical protein IVB19_39020 [Bradyrhizobium sp. 187]